jgi:hypothetical protein
VVGDQDVLYGADKRLAALLTAHGVKLTFQPVPGHNAGFPGGRKFASN